MKLILLILLYISGFGLVVQEILDDLYIVQLKEYRIDRLRDFFSSKNAKSTKTFIYIKKSFIKDLYNTAYLLDYGFIAYGSFPYVLAHACEVERNGPGQGVEYLRKLKRSIPEEEEEVFVEKFISLNILLILLLI